MSQASSNNPLIGAMKTFCGEESFKNLSCAMAAGSSLDWSSSCVAGLFWPGKSFGVGASSLKVGSMFGSCNLQQKKNIKRWSKKSTKERLRRSVDSGSRKVYEQHG